MVDRAPLEGVCAQKAPGVRIPLSPPFDLKILYNTFMLDFAQKLMGKPSDRNIRIIRIIFALILLVVIYFGWDVTSVNFGLPTELKYALYIFPTVGLIRGIFDPGLFRKKIWKWTIFGLGVAMLLISLVFIEDQAHPLTQSTAQTTSSGTLDVGNITQTSVPWTVSTDNWFGVFGFFVAFFGFFLNNKNITRKNERYGEKVTKIRV